MVGRNDNRSELRRVPRDSEGGKSDFPTTSKFGAGEVLEHPLMTCNVLPAFTAGAWAAVVMMLVCIGAGYLCGTRVSRPTVVKLGPPRDAVSDIGQ